MTIHRLKRLLRALPGLLLLAGCPATRTSPVVRPEADIVVAPDSTGRYQTINEALQHARDGDVILVLPGTYREQVRIGRSRRVTLRGIDPATTIVDASDRYAAIEVSTDSNRVSGLTLRNADSHGIWVRDGHQEIDHCLAVNNGEHGIYLSAMVGNASASVDHCTVADNGQSGIYAARDSEATAITNSIVACNPRGIVTDRNAGLMTVKDNCLHNNSADFDRVSPGPNNVMADPMFMNRQEGDYRIARNSPAARAADDQTNFGCF